ncbi:MAG: M15 family metallopeptidase [Firmicutes bacterium]|nr:M15 family metallopeptidase [Bacillota bacterium]
MRTGQKKTRIRVNGKRLAVSLLVLILAVAAVIFVITRITSAAQAKKAEEARLLEEQRLEEQRRLEEENRKNEEQNGDPAPDPAAEARAYALENGFLILLNKEHSVGEDYKAADMLQLDEEICCSDRPVETHLLRAEAADQFAKMIAAAKADGYEIKATTAYRSYYYQNGLYTNYVTKYGEAEADRFSARPGTSEHQSGLAADLSCASVNWQLVNKFGDTAEGKWIAAHCAEYGFILRYPKERSEERTGYIYEPWHVRYVTIPVATEIMNEGLVLEEYLAKYAITQ